MSKIKIRNFGPIKEGYQEDDGWMDIKKVTVFIGNQGSGKSTVAKTIATLSWLEKALNRGDVSNIFSLAEFKNLFQYQRIDNYFKSDTEISYEGEMYHIDYDPANSFPLIFEVDKVNYVVPKIMYIPADRNFLSTIRGAFNVKGLPENLFSFGEEFRKAQKDLNGKKLKLPLGDYTYEYDEYDDISFISGENYRLNLLEASSGLQTFVPLYLVTHFLTNSLPENQENFRKELSVDQAIRMTDGIMQVMSDNSLEVNEKNIIAAKIKSRYFNKCLINIVEEPEQNLYPSSQRKMLNSLLEFNNNIEGNKLIMTTHSPYLINYLTLAVKTYSIKEKLKDENIKIKLQEITPLSSVIKPDDLIVYELNEEFGGIKRLETYNGLPSDENLLNERLGETNELFGQLLDIEQSL